MDESFDARMMQRAIFHAARGAGRTTPNPMVGAVVVASDGVVAGHGWHQRAGEPHAEVHALDEAGTLARGGTLYVSLEPCCHTGRTGPCTRRIIDAGITRVVAAMRDPDARVSGRGFEELRAQGIRVDEGLGMAESARLNEAFTRVKTGCRPLVLAKAATSLDGCVAARPGERTALTSPEANRRTQILRASVDAVGVGSGTVLADDPLLTGRECYRVRPLVRVVFDRRLRTPPTARLFSTLSAGPVIMVTGRAHDADRAARLTGAGATIVAVGSLLEGLQALVRWDVSSLLVEGGPALHTGLWRDGLIDRLTLIVAPHILGPAGVRWIDAADLPFASLTPTTIEPRGCDIWIDADVHRNH